MKFEWDENKAAMEDDLRSEYDLNSLRVRKFGPERKSFGKTTIRLEPDLAEVFPNADAVNEALSLGASQMCKFIFL